VRRAHAALREHVAFLHRDRALAGDVRTMCELVRQRRFATASSTEIAP
jgi:histidine ammonia-lyase